MERLQRNRRALRERLERACRAAGRNPADVRLVAVTKTVGPELALALFRLGERELGESRAGELERKHAFFAERAARPRWHFVGHLQRNKARRVLRLADEIHSVDSLSLLATLTRIAEEEGRRPGIYLQAKLTDEPAKSGARAQELPSLFDEARAGPLPLLGLMAMAPFEDEAGARAAAAETFRTLARLAAALPHEAFADGRPRLSMGMSGDFPEAIEAGADLVRIGSAFFEGVSEPAPGPGARRGPA